MLRAKSFENIFYTFHGLKTAPIKVFRIENKHKPLKAALVAVLANGNENLKKNVK